MKIRMSHIFLVLAAIVTQATSANGQWCESGILSSQGDVCCAEQCGQCGGPGCNRFPGGSSKCCTGVIRRTEKSCTSQSDVACLVPVSGYDRHAEAHIGAHNIATYHHKTLAECAEICNNLPHCESFEFGVDYGKSAYSPGACNPQDTQNEDLIRYNTADDGYNLDLYTKNGVCSDSCATEPVREACKKVDECGGCAECDGQGGVADYFDGDLRLQCAWWCPWDGFSVPQICEVDYCMACAECDGQGGVADDFTGDLRLQCHLECGFETKKTACEGHRCRGCSYCDGEGGVLPVAIYEGCFANQGDNRIEVDSSIANRKTIESCQEAAIEAGETYFGKEWPEGTSIENAAFCSVLSGLPQLTKVDDSECGVEIDADKRKLGGAYRMAVYRIGSADRPNYGVPEDGLIFRLDMDTISDYTQYVPSSAILEDDHMHLSGEAMAVPFESNPNHQPTVTYVTRFRVHDIPNNNRGWIMSQSPDFGWSRAMSISDSRLGYVGQTPGVFDSNLGQIKTNEWNVLIGTWTQNGNCQTWLNGVAGANRTCSNGKGYSDQEELIIGGRLAINDHNPNSIDISHALVYNRELTDEEVIQVVVGLSEDDQDVIRSVQCGESFSGETHARHRVHTYEYTAVSTVLSFDSCATEDFDTVLKIFDGDNYLVVDDDHKGKCEASPSRWTSRIDATGLEIGKTYFLSVEAHNMYRFGHYDLHLECAGPTSSPTMDPTVDPSEAPSKSPSKSPSMVPSRSPTTSRPTEYPTKAPSKTPSKSPSKAPTFGPTPSPTTQPTVSPTSWPTPSPTSKPTADPTKAPSKSPSKTPSKSPSKSPSQAPTYGPTPSPTSQPTENPTKTPSKSPSKSPSKAPTFGPTPSPTTQPTVDPTKSPSKSPSESPSKAPTPSPTDAPSNSPTTDSPSTTPSTSPTVSPTSSSPSTSPTAGDFIVKVQGFVGNPQDFIDWEIASQDQHRMNAYQFDFVRQLKKARPTPPLTTCRNVCEENTCEKDASNTLSANEVPSCSSACYIRELGVSKQECLRYCKREAFSGCRFTIAGKAFSVCKHNGVRGKMCHGHLQPHDCMLGCVNYPDDATQTDSRKM